MTESESGVLPLHYTSIFSWQSGFALLNNISIFGRGCQEKMRISQQKIRIIAGDDPLRLQMANSLRMDAAFGAVPCITAGFSLY